VGLGEVRERGDLLLRIARQRASFAATSTKPGDMVRVDIKKLGRIPHGGDHKG
jgi:hypothetical protein